MSDTKHTPGPIRVTDKRKPATGLTSDGWGPIAEIVGGYSDEEKEANARHLAHCWNTHHGLLEALEAVLKKGSRWHPSDPVVMKAKAALATARA